MKVQLIIIAAALALTACGDKDKKKGNSTFAKLAVANNTGISLNATANTYTPTVFGLKLIDVRLMTGLDSTQNPAPIIWYNPECGTATTTETEINEKLYEYTQSPGCDLTKVTKYFDFSRPTATVNADLNSQPNKVYPADYHYVSISWCEGQNTDNVQFQAEGMTEPATGSTGGCGTISAQAVPPLSIAEGETVTISLDYSIEGIVSDSGSGENCWTDGTISRCFNMPVMTPKATKS